MESKDIKEVIFVNVGSPEGIVRSIEHLEGHELLTETTGRHQICEGDIDVYLLSETHNVLLCRKCGLRLPFLNHIKTWPELRDSSIFKDNPSKFK